MYELKTNTAVRIAVGPLVDPGDYKTAETSLTVTGMSCGGCAASLQKALLAQPAVRTATVDFASRQAVIESELSKAELIALIEARGFQVE